MGFGETETEMFRPDGKVKLMVYEWLPDAKARVVFVAVYGGMAHAGDWVTPAIYFKAKGVATIEALQTVPEKFLTLMVHKNNYHENFNETNREVTSKAIWNWMRKNLKR